MPKIRPGAAKSGDKIKFHFTVKLPTGFVVNTTLNGSPAETVLGSGQAVKGLEKALRGLLPGESKTVIVQSQNAFGERKNSLMVPVAKNQLEDRQYLPGQVTEFKQPNGVTIPARIRLVDEFMVMFDLNHPLAGHDLTYEVQMIEVVSGNVNKKIRGK
ncbi:MAG: FKBP-type peptidyl-prolyl cis-trans isomerase [bacterium]|nr:FKBP-type peptidyl-prolyl cis-trans isomerase [bacterium]